MKPTPSDHQPPAKNRIKNQAISSETLSELLLELGTEMEIEVQLISKGSDHRITCDVNESIQPQKGFWFGKVNYTFDVGLESLTITEAKDKIRGKLLLARTAFWQSLQKKLGSVQFEQNPRSQP